MAKSNFTNFNRVMIETGIIKHGVIQYRDITDQVMFISNLLAGCDNNKSSEYYETCRREAERLQNTILPMADDDQQDEVSVQ